MNYSDTGAAIVARDAAIERVEIGAGDFWNSEALAAVIRVAMRQPTLTAEDCRQECRVHPREPRAWGAVMKRAMKAGAIRGTDRTVVTGRVESHGRPMKVWNSLVFKGAK